jgi:hypothetical protein
VSFCATRAARRALLQKGTFFSCSCTTHGRSIDGELMSRSVTRRGETRACVLGLPQQRFAAQVAVVVVGDERPSCYRVGRIVARGRRERGVRVASSSLGTLSVCIDGR